MGKRKRKKPVVHYERPTTERESHSEFRSAGPAVKAIPPIETLCAKGDITVLQFFALQRYADVANAAERSEIKSGLDFSPRSNGNGLPFATLRSNGELEWFNRQLGPVKLTAQAICVRGLTASQYAMERSGAVERCRGNVCWFVPRHAALQKVLHEIRQAGELLVEALA